jgi:hypothetical protein
MKFQHRYARLKEKKEVQIRFLPDVSPAEQMPHFKFWSKLAKVYLYLPVPLHFLDRNIPSHSTFLDLCS